jgi:NAD(P)H-hydrate epimerase
MNRAPAPVVALDIPSGADAVTGDTPGPVVQADCTIALGWPKLGSLLHPARAHAGRLVGVEIGFPEPGPDTFRAHAITPAWGDQVRPRRDPDSHKNRAGNVLVLAGRVGMAGAAILSARAAIRSGAGYVRIASVGGNRSLLQEAVPDAVFVDRDDREALAEAAAAASALLIGPGMGTDPEAAGAAQVALDAAPGTPVVMDADALTLLAEATAGPASALAEWTGDREVVLTPHPGEMARLLDQAVPEVMVDRPGRARALAAETGAVILLKGIPSVVGRPDGSLLVDTVGTSDLAAAGMGDALAGSIAALQAQGTPAATAAGLGLLTTGRAAVLADRGAGLSPEEVIGCLPDALREGPGETDLPHPFVLFDQDPAR